MGLCLEAGGAGMGQVGKTRLKRDGSVPVGSPVPSLMGYCLPLLPENIGDTHNNPWFGRVRMQAEGDTPRLQPSQVLGYPPLPPAEPAFVHPTFLDKRHCPGLQLMSSAGSILHSGNPKLLGRDFSIFLL